MIRAAGMVSALLLVLSSPARAHCDTLQGPVVMAARAALDAQNPDLVLHWVRPEDEPAVWAAFQHTLAVRGLGPEAKALADRYFFETIVRIHRAGEGAPYTGLAEGEPEPIIAATDRALASGSTAELEEQLVGAVRTGLGERFTSARAAKDFRPGDVAGGRAFVATYVPLTHWVEGVFTAATRAGEHHGAAMGQPGPAHEGGHQAAHAEGRAEPHARTRPHPVPWLLASALAVIAVVEGAFLVRRRQSGSG